MARTLPRPASRPGAGLLDPRRHMPAFDARSPRSRVGISRAITPAPTSCPRPDCWAIACPLALSGVNRGSRCRSGSTPGSSTTTERSPAGMPGCELVGISGRPSMDIARTSAVVIAYPIATIGSPPALQVSAITGGRDRPAAQPPSGNSARHQPATPADSSGTSAIDLPFARGGAALTPPHAATDRPMSNPAPTAVTIRPATPSAPIELPLPYFIAAVRRVTFRSYPIRRRACCLLPTLPGIRPRGHPLQWHTSCLL